MCMCVFHLFKIFTYLWEITHLNFILHKIYLIYICICFIVILFKIIFITDIDKRLVVVRDRSVVGCLPGGHDVYKIKKISLLPLNQQHLPDVEFEVCIANIVFNDIYCCA